MRKKLNVLLLFDSPAFKPRGYSFEEEFKDPNWSTESGVYQALRQCGYVVSLIGLLNDISVLLEEIKHNRPDVIFNLTECFNQESHLEKNVAALLEMLEIPFTGASPASLFICNDKALSKKILSFHKIRVPNFHTFYRQHRVWHPKSLRLPLIVKPLCEEASRGIAQASIVDSEESLIDRVRFIHDSMAMDAIAEEYIDGRELYVSVIGNRRIRVLPPREIKFGQFPEDEPRIATYKAKWDAEYQKKWGIKHVFAGKLPNGVDKKIEDICKRAYRALNMKCYARFDMRVTSDSRIYIIEPNANPCLARYDEVAESADKVGISYENLVRKIIDLAFQRA